MSIDFEIPAEAKAIREKVRQWVHDHCIPAEKELDSKPLADVLGPLQAKARAQATASRAVARICGDSPSAPWAKAAVEEVVTASWTSGIEAALALETEEA